MSGLRPPWWILSNGTLLVAGTLSALVPSMAATPNAVMILPGFIWVSTVPFATMLPETSGIFEGIFMTGHVFFGDFLSRAPVSRRRRRRRGTENDRLMTIRLRVDIVGRRQSIVVREEVIVVPRH